jgi:hypothetical protein
VIQKQQKKKERKKERQKKERNRNNDLVVKTSTLARDKMKSIQPNFSLSFDQFTLQQLTLNLQKYLLVFNVKI